MVSGENPERPFLVVAHETPAGTHPATQAAIALHSPGVTATTYTVLAEKAVPPPTGSTTGAYGSKPQGGAPSMPAPPPAGADPALTDPAAQPGGAQWAGDEVDPGAEDVSDPAVAFAMFAGANGETAWLDVADDGTITGWVEDADGTIYRYSDTDAWAIDVDDVQMSRQEPGAPAEGEIDEFGDPIDAGAEVDDEGNPIDAAAELDEDGNPIDPDAEGEVDDESLDGQTDAFDEGDDVTPPEDVPEEIMSGEDAEATDQALDGQDGPTDEFGNPLEPGADDAMDPDAAEEDEEELDEFGRPKKKGKVPPQFQGKAYAIAVRTL